MTKDYLKILTKWAIREKQQLLKLNNGTGSKTEYMQGCEHAIDNVINKLELKAKVEHNQCDICFKKFSSAVGFHHHYPECVKKNGRQKVGSDSQ